MHETIISQGLCRKVLGMEKGRGACFNYQIKKCRGACVGEDSPLLHEARLTTSLAKLKLRSWPFPGAAGIKEVSADGDKSAIHIFDHWRHLGTAHSDEDVREILGNRQALPFDLDSYKILKRFLDQNKHRLSLIVF